jgi:hypothetical protein
LHHEIKKFERKALEGWYILKMKPTLNINKGICLVGADTCIHKNKNIPVLV